MLRVGVKEGFEESYYYTPLRFAATQCFALLGADKPAIVANNAHSALSPFPRDSKVTPSATLVPVEQLYNLLYYI